MKVMNEGPKSAPEVISFGCRLNAAEGDAVRRVAGAAGAGDSVVINSCAVTNEAVRQTRQAIRRAHKRSPNQPIIVTGCAAQIDPEKFARMPEVSSVLGNHEKLSPDAWRKVIEERTDTHRVLVNDILSVRTDASHFVDGFGERARAFLQIQTGCNHRCTFCIIPYGRGNAVSAPIEAVIRKARALVDAGHRELVLTGVDITSWGEDLEGAPKLGDLVDAILCTVPKLYRLRLSSIDGAELDEKLQARIVTDERIAPYIHLSVQSGSNMILKRMKRRHSREDIIALCRELRSKRPELAFGADLIAGFPTETEEMFAESASLVAEAGLNFLHVFPFSPRDGTPAARMPQLNGAVIKDRAARLRAIGEAATTDFLDGLVGTRFSAIAESGGRARLGNFAIVETAERLDAGNRVDVVITGRSGLKLYGELA